MEFIIDKKIMKWAMAHMIRKEIEKKTMTLDKRIKNNQVIKFKKYVENTAKNIFYFEYKKTLEKSDNYLLQLKNKHRNERCFIVATGPSINKTNLSLLRNEIIFGMNTLFKAKDRLPQMPKYWAVIDEHVFQNNHRDILQLDSTIFLSGGAGRCYLENKEKFDKMAKNEPIIIRSYKDMNIWKEMSTNPIRGINGAKTVTIDVCIQVAYWLGFKEVYLLGCDTDYTTTHHFHGRHKHMSGIEGTGPWTKKNELNDILEAYAICKKAFEQGGRKIYNATVGGKLEVFERKKLEDVIDG